MKYSLKNSSLYLVGAILAFATPAFAANTKISAMPAATALTGVEAFPCVQSAVTNKCTVTQAVTFTYSLLSGDCTATSGGAITCTKSNGSAFAALAFKTQASLTADVAGLLPIANGGTGTASPALIAGTNITITGAWPNQTINSSGGGGGVSSVGETFTGGLISVAGSPITTSGTFALTIAGTSGGIPYFDSATTWATSAALGAGLLVKGGGAGVAPATFTLGGDCTFSTPNITCTKTSGVAFTGLATATVPLSVANGGTGTASPGLTAGTGITLGSVWPTQSVALTTPVAIANGGNGTASPGLTAGAGITLGSSWPTQSVALTSPVAIANGGTANTTAAAAFNALSPMTTIGDVIYGGASGVGTRLANGTSGQFLGANTGAAPSWQTPAGAVASPEWTDYSTSLFYVPWPQAVSTSAGAVDIVGHIDCSPGVIRQKMTLAGLSVDVTTVDAGKNVQLALYTSSAGRPGALIASTASGSTTSLGIVSPAFGSSVQVGPGGTAGGPNLWFCSERDTGVAVFLPNYIIPSVMQTVIGTATTANLFNTTTDIMGVSCATAACNGGVSTFGTWPASLAGSTWTDITGRIAPVFFYQPSSIP